MRSTHSDIVLTALDPLRREDGCALRSPMPHILYDHPTTPPAPEFIERLGLEPAPLGVATVIFVEARSEEAEHVHRLTSHSGDMPCVDMLRAYLDVRSAPIALEEPEFLAGVHDLLCDLATVLQRSEA